MYLVTGGAGFMGTHLVRRLVDEGISVRVLDRQVPKGLPKTKFEFIKGDITDAGDVKRAVKGVESVFHLAAMSRIQESIKDPAMAESINSMGTLNVLEACRRAGVNKLVFSSSAEIYGNGNDPNQPKTENTIPRPISPYAVTKMLGEYYCRVFYKIHGMDTVSLRFFSVYGPGQSRTESERYVSYYISKLKKDQQPVVYYDGLQTSDLIYVDDAIDAIMLVHKNTNTGQSINIGSGRPVTGLEVLAMLNKIMEKDIEPEAVPARAGEIKHLVADISLAKKLGFEPRTGLFDGLRKTIESFDR